MTPDEHPLRDTPDPSLDDRAEPRPAPGDPPSSERNVADGELERALAAFYA